jgi:hypothetical protein
MAGQPHRIADRVQFGRDVNERREQGIQQADGGEAIPRPSTAIVPAKFTMMMRRHRRASASVFTTVMRSLPMSITFGALTRDISARRHGDPHAGLHERRRVVDTDRAPIGRS